MANRTEKLRQLAKVVKQREAASPTGELSENDVVRLMHLLVDDHMAEFTCESTFNLLDEYAEVAVDDPELAAALMPLVKSHLDKCGHCCGCFDALLSAINEESTLTEI
jgi:hypothetical protein